MYIERAKKPNQATLAKIRRVGFDWDQESYNQKLDKGEYIDLGSLSYEKGFYTLERTLSNSTSRLLDKNLEKTVVHTE